MKIELLGFERLIWPLGRQDSVPEYRCGGGSYERTFKVDPFPCYAHDLERAEITAKMCEEAFPLPDARLKFYILSHDFTDRINGLTFEDSIYNHEDGTEWDEKIPSYKNDGSVNELHGQAITIALAGKRIPLMPSMTRYLVSHEYGHAAFNYVARKMGYRDHEKDKLEALYMEMRGVEDYSKIYTGAQWHRSPGEIIANDFRILFTKQEMEFFPHDCSLPSWHDKPLANWWIAALRACQLDDRADRVDAFVSGKKKDLRTAPK
jgi:hypothetical protein